MYDVTGTAFTPDTPSYGRNNFGKLQASPGGAQLAPAVGAAAQLQVTPLRKPHLPPLDLRNTTRQSKSSPAQYAHSSSSSAKLRRGSRASTHLTHHFAPGSASVSVPLVQHIGTPSPSKFSSPLGASLSLGHKRFSLTGPIDSVCSGALSHRSTASSATRRKRAAFGAQPAPAAPWVPAATGASHRAAGPRDNRAPAPDACRLREESRQVPAAPRAVFRPSALQTAPADVCHEQHESSFMGATDTIHIATCDPGTAASAALPLPTGHAAQVGTEVTRSNVVATATPTPAYGSSVQQQQLGERPADPIAADTDTPSSDMVSPTAPQSEQTPACSPYKKPFGARSTEPHSVTTAERSEPALAPATPSLVDVAAVPDAPAGCARPDALRTVPVPFLGSDSAAPNSLAVKDDTAAPSFQAHAQGAEVGADAHRDTHARHQLATAPSDGKLEHDMHANANAATDLQPLADGAAAKAYASAPVRGKWQRPSRNAAAASADHDCSVGQPAVAQETSANANAKKRGAARSVPLRTSQWQRKSRSGKLAPDKAPWSGPGALNTTSSVGSDVSSVRSLHERLCSTSKSIAQARRRQAAAALMSEASQRQRQNAARTAVLADSPGVAQAQQATVQDLESAMATSGHVPKQSDVATDVHGQAAGQGQDVQRTVEDSAHIAADDSSAAVAPAPAAAEAAAHAATPDEASQASAQSPVQRREPLQPSKLPAAPRYFRSMFVCYVAVDSSALACGSLCQAPQVPLQTNNNTPCTCTFRWSCNKCWHACRRSMTREQGAVQFTESHAEPDAGAQLHIRTDGQTTGQAAYDCYVGLDASRRERNVRIQRPAHALQVGHVSWQPARASVHALVLLHDFLLS